MMYLVSEHLQLWMLFYLGSILSFTFSNFAKAALATYLGDESPRALGFLSLNPGVHVDIMMTLTMLLTTVALVFLKFSQNTIFLTLLLIIFSLQHRWQNIVPLNRAKYRDPQKHMAWISLIGVFSGIFFTWLLFVSFRILLALKFISPLFFLKTMIPMLISVCSMMIYISLFSLLPWDPIDGYYIYDYYFPKIAEFTEEMNPVWILLSIVIIFSTGIFQYIVMYLLSIIFALAGFWL